MQANLEEANSSNQGQNEALVKKNKELQDKIIELNANNKMLEAHLNDIGKENENLGAKLDKMKEQLEISKSQ